LPQRCPDVSSRTVRFLQTFFDDLDSQLPAQRGVGGVPSSTDFLLYDLPTIRDLLADDFERHTTEMLELSPMRLFIGAGTLVRGVVLYAYVAADDAIDVVALELQVAE